MGKEYQKKSDTVATETEVVTKDVTVTEVKDEIRRLDGLKLDAAALLAELQSRLQEASLNCAAKLSDCNDQIHELQAKLDTLIALGVKEQASEDGAVQS